ncbi:MAG: bifunctional phosphopantothenoylcysteine decarboxylase/phosphopantothenate--cysteine ligase CoaBC [Thermomicrobiales bacterium]
MRRDEIAHWGRNAIPKLGEPTTAVGTARSKHVSVLDSAKVVLGVSGGIAAYKAADLASKLVQAGAIVDVVMTDAARRFIAPLTFEAITKRPVHLDAFEPWTETSFGHVSLARDARIVLIAPATANTIARIAHGLADDMLTAVALATTAPLLVAPAMEHGMYHHPATRANIALLCERGAVMVGPETGRLASGYEGDGRLATVDAIVGSIRKVLGRNGPLADRHVVVTAGGTKEPLDPVRYLGNRSSGRMGYAIAQAAIDHGARVTLITGPTVIPPPIGVDLIPVGAAIEMQRAVEAAVQDADALVMAAAVADFRPRESHSQKIKKGAHGEPVSIPLVRNPDIVAGIDRPGLVKIGFAAETDDLIEHARAKLRAKGLSLIVANDAVATIGSDAITAILIAPDAPPEHLPHQTKGAVAQAIVTRLVSLLAEGPR